jgi:hypothetical protein
MLLPDPCRGRILTWSLMLGAIFPDSDVFRVFSSDRLLIITRIAASRTSP